MRFTASLSVGTVRRMSGESLVPDGPFTVQVTSFGGVGTTALYAHLESLGVDVPRASDWGWPKHQRIPPHRADVPEGFRAVYVFGDPRDAILSVFRRGYEIWHYERMQLPESAPTGRAEAALRSTADFARSGFDPYKIDEHLGNWLAVVDVPVLFIHHEVLSTRWEAIRAFIGLPVAATPLPSNQRKTDWRSEPDEIRDGFTSIYGELAEFIGRLPRVFLAGGLEPRLAVALG